MLQKDPPNISLVSCPTDWHSNSYWYLQIKFLSQNVKFMLCMQGPKKTFDSVSNSHLLNKLRALGIITWKVRKRLEAYLKYCYQGVKIGQTYVCNVLSGLLQWSVLLPTNIPFIFAECLRQVIRSAKDTGKLQNDVNNASIWSNSSDLFFN